MSGKIRFCSVIILWIICCVAFEPCRCADSAEQTDRIVTNILANYKSDVHPKAKDDGSGVVMRISLVPLHITMDEEAAVLHTHGWLGMGWNDDRLKWDKSQYGDVESVHLAPQRVWKGDIRAFNSISHEDYEDTNIIVHSDGRIFWIPPVTFHTSCDFDYKYWPWDEQQCYIVIGSWTKTGEELDVVNMSGHNVSRVSLANFSPTIWDIQSPLAYRNKKYYGELASWPDITVRLRLRRQSYVDQKIAVLPIILVASITLATFWTFPLSKSRIMLGMTNLLILVLVLLYLRSRLPMAGAQLPLVISFAGSVSVLVTIQLMMALAIANLVSRKDAAPSMLVAPLDGMVGKVLCLSDMPLIGQLPSTGSYAIDMEAMNIASANDVSGDKKVDSTGWSLITQAIDRIMFAFYLLIIVIFLGVYLGGAAAGQN